MSLVCPAPQPDALVLSLLRAADCQAEAFGRSGFAVLNGAGSPLPALVAVMLTLCVAFLGYGLIFGRSSARLGDLAMLAIRIGLVVTLTSGWNAYQVVAYDLLTRGPIQIGALLLQAAPVADRRIAQDPFQVLQEVHDDLARVAETPAGASTAAVGGAGDAPGPTGGADGGAKGAPADAQLAARVMVSSTLGVILVARLGLAVVLALGPLFISLVLFEATRGFFAGWVRAATTLALASLFGLVNLLTTLNLAQPAAEAVALGGPASSAAGTLLLIVTTISALGAAFAVVTAAVIGLGFRWPAVVWKAPRPAAAPVVVLDHAPRASARQLGAPPPSATPGRGSETSRIPRRLRPADPPSAAPASGAVAAERSPGRIAPSPAAERRRAQPFAGASARRRSS